MINREPVKLRIIEVLNQASIDEGKFNVGVGTMVDEIIEQTKLEVLSDVREMFKKFRDNQEIPKEEKDHRSFGKVRVAGDPQR